MHAHKPQITEATFKDKRAKIFHNYVREVIEKTIFNDCF